MTTLGGAQFDLLDKNELKIVGIELRDADLRELAEAAAEVFELENTEVLVTDYLDRTLTFDILRRTVYPHQLLGRSTQLLNRVGAVPGVHLDSTASIESRGMLGWIAADGEDIGEAMAAAASRAEDLLERIAKRVMIFSTGAELVSGEVRDTNAELIAAVLGEIGYACDRGGALRDDADLIAGAIRTAIDRGFGLIITTGGVGAESKDCTVEAVLKLDPAAATPYIVRFEIDDGRHQKDGVRIAVGSSNGALIVALPGPNDEVRRAVAVLSGSLAAGHSIIELAEEIAKDLRDVLRERMQHRHGTE